MLEIIEKYSYFGLFVILVIEETGFFLPIPGDLFIAAVSSFNDANYFLVVTTVVLATLIGSTILFTLARKFGNPLIKKYGKTIKITPEKINKMEKWFDKYGGLAIVFGRLIPGLRTITPIVAGVFKVSYTTFWIYTFIAAFIWANIYFFAGKFLGSLFLRLVS